jgi:hypothetical protein
MMTLILLNAIYLFDVCLIALVFGRVEWAFAF